MEDDMLALDNSMGQDLTPNVDVPVEEVTEEITPEVIQNTYAPPFKSKIGNSSVDLSLRENEQMMTEEYNNWWNLGLKWGRVAPEHQEERNKLREDWYQKYYGMSYEDYESKKPKTTMYGYTADLKGTAEHIDNMFQGLMAPGLGVADFAMDFVGLFPGGNKLDNWWDANTKLDSPTHQTIREISSVVIPSLYTGYGTSALLTKAGIQNMPWLARHLTRLGAWTVESQIIAGISDTSEEHNAARVVSDLLPGIFGQQGFVPLPEAWKTHDGDSPAVRKQKNMWESAALSWIGVALGSFVDMKRAATSGTKVKQLDWFIPKDDTAVKYRQGELFEYANEYELDRVSEIQELLQTKTLSKQDENILINELLQLEDELGIVNSFDDAIRRSDVSAAKEINDTKILKAENPDQLELDLGLGIDPELAPELFDPSTTAKQVTPPGNIARNMADTTAIKSGNSVGDPAPLITSSMAKKGLMVGNESRDVVMGMAESARMTGDFDAIVDGFRYSGDQMNAAAWAIYKDIISADTIEDVKSLFLTNRDVKNLLLGRFKVTTINEEQARAAAFALRDLTDRFLGREVTEASARVMDTLGRESSTLARAMTEMAPFIDDERAMNLLLDKMLFLMNEYALNKYVSGWQLINKKWWDNVPPDEFDNVVNEITKGFTDASSSINAKNKKFIQTLKALKKTQPEAIRPLVDAFAHTDGDVDSLAKLYKWTEQQVTPWGAIRSPNPKEMNLFARGLWGVQMNNILSGLSPIGATIGNTYQLMMKPIDAFLGHGFWGVVDRSTDGLQRTLYYYGGFQETNRRALTDAWKMMKKAHKDPKSAMKVYRKDFQLKASKSRMILDEMRKVYEKDGNWGMLKQIDIAIGLNEIAAIPGLRYGMTALVFPDAYTTTMLATYLTRARAYNDVFYEFGFADMSRIKVAETEIYKQMFDGNGLPKDPVLKALAGEIQLNLDDGLANWLNQATTAYPVTKFQFMFPRTQSNAAKLASSWTPLTLIPGFSKYSKTIYARTDDQIARALADHGINMATTPNARILWEDLRAEYTGRLMFSGMMVTSLFGYAMAGNIRGNGHYQAGRRMKERDQFGYRPYTIRFPVPGEDNDIWIDYSWMPGVRQVLSILGDMAYYARDLNEPMLENWQNKLMWSLSASFLGETPLMSFEPFVAIINGDLAGFQRFGAQVTRTMIPQSSALGVLANAIDSAQKDLSGEIHEYVMNKIPGLKNTLPNQIDIWTGLPLNDVNNPWMKVFNAISPIKVSADYPEDLFEMHNGKKVFAKDVIKWLQRDLNFAGLSKLNMDSTGSYEYSTNEREIINKLIGQQEVWRQIVPIMMNKDYIQSLDALQAHRHTGTDLNNDKIQLKLHLLPVYKEVERVLRIAQETAESQIEIGAGDIIDQQMVDRNMQYGNVEGAAGIQKKNLETQKLLQYNNN